MNLNTNDVLIPESWVSHFLLELSHQLQHADYKGVVARTYKISYIIKDGDLSKSFTDLLVRYILPAAKEIAEQITGEEYVYPDELDIPTGARVSTACFDNLRAVCVMNYDSLSAGTKVTFKV